MNENRLWLITGVSSGFGRAVAEAALDRVDRVVATARNPGQLSNLAADDGVHVIALNVTDAEQRLSAIDQAVEEFGRIDVLVNNAGRTQVGAVEETIDDELRSLFELHFFAPVALTRAVLPHMRAQGSGAIGRCPVSAVRSPPPGFGAYCMTKVALEGITQALNDEVAPFGIRTLIVEPGAFRTGLFPAGRGISIAADGAIRPDGWTNARLRQRRHGSQPGDPAKAAQAILAALDADEPPLAPSPRRGRDRQHPRTPRSGNRRARALGGARTSDRH